MRLTIISCVFLPEPVVSAQTSEELARALTHTGHKVTVIAPFPSRPSGRLRKEDKFRILRRSHEEGFEVWRCRALTSRRSTLWSRFLENVTFGLMSALVVLGLPRPQAIYANSWPLFATGAIHLVALLRRVPVVTSVQDIYPETLAIQSRLSGDSLAIRALRRLDTWIAHGSAALVLISPRLREHYVQSRALPEGVVHTVPNWIDRQRIVVDQERSREYRRQIGVPESAFVAVYGGSVGTAAGVELLIEAMAHIDADLDLHLVIAGEGGRLTRCKELADGMGGSRVLFHTPYPLSENAMVLGAADLLLLPTMGGQAQAGLPSKLLAYMLAARPVLAAAVRDSDLADMIQRAGCGWVVPPGNPEALAERISEIMSLTASEREAMGRAGREYALNNLVGDVLLPRLVTVIESAARNP